MSLADDNDPLRQQIEEVFASPWSDGHHRVFPTLGKKTWDVVDMRATRTVATCNTELDAKHIATLLNMWDKGEMS